MQQRAEQFFEELLADRTALEVDVDSAAEQLREVTRSTARVLQTQPAIMDMVRRKSDQSEGTYRFCEYLRDLTVCQRCRFLAHVLEGTLLTVGCMNSAHDSACAESDAGAAVDDGGAGAVTQRPPDSAEDQDHK